MAETVVDTGLQGSQQGVTTDPLLIKLISDVVTEIHSAELLHPEFPSAHHGYGVLLEELEELWDLVREKENEHRYWAMYKEAKQVACVAIRFMKYCDSKMEF